MTRSMCSLDDASSAYIHWWDLERMYNISQCLHLLSSCHGTIDGINSVDSRVSSIEHRAQSVGDGR